MTVESNQRSSHALAKCARRQGENADVATSQYFMHAKLKHKHFA
jgi:hypothetical protein